MLEKLADAVESMPEEKRGEIVGRVIVEITSVFVDPGTVVIGMSKAALLPVIAGRVRTVIRAMDGLALAERELILLKLAELDRLSAALNVPGSAGPEILSAFWRARGLGPNLHAWETFEAVMLKVRELERAGKVTRGDVLDAAEAAIKEAYKEGDVPSVARIRQTLGGFLKPNDLETNHVDAMEWFARQVEIRDGLQPGTIRLDDPAFKALADQMPGYPLKRTWHNFGQGVGGRPTFHDMAEQLFREEGVPVNNGEWRDFLRRLYDRFHQEYGVEASFDFNKVEHQLGLWLDAQGIR